MKQKDIALIIVVTVVSAVMSVIISGKIFAPPKNRHRDIKTVQAISTDFPKPDPKYFNSSAIDPTQLIRIGSSTNSSPFNGSGQ